MRQISTFITCSDPHRSRLHSGAIRAYPAGRGGTIRKPGVQFEWMAVFPHAVPIQSGFRGNSVCARWKHEFFALRRRGATSISGLCKLAEPSETGRTRTTINKLIVLTDIYNLSIERLIRSMYPGDAQPLSLRLRMRPCC
jgi:hypothetical protein